ncbi:unnamed protein product [Hymenolepis diminuta]|uniref:Uncharacterized protein n=1 Tax=Hymenolepis diminuta TaxID=6216 RepID=A0A564Y6P4_HYMDI|nr:unnamed protein product [Hymenolepis diminuta]
MRQMFAGLEKSLSNLVAEKMAHEENKRKGASGTLNRRNALDVTYLIEATSTNRTEVRTLRGHSDFLPYQTSWRDYCMDSFLERFCQWGP